MISQQLCEISKDGHKRIRLRADFYPCLAAEVGEKIAEAGAEEITAVAPVSSVPRCPMLRHYIDKTDYRTDCPVVGSYNCVFDSTPFFDRTSQPVRRQHKGYNWSFLQFCCFAQGRSPRRNTLVFDPRSTISTSSIGGCDDIVVHSCDTDTTANRHQKGKRVVVLG